MVLDFKYFPLVYLLVVVTEVIILSFSQQRKQFDIRDTFTNILTGSIGIIITGALLKTSVIFVLFYLYKFSLLRLQFSYWSFVPCLIFLDFLFYIAHRVSHRINIGWAAHIVHHSSDKFNFSTAITQVWTQHYFAIFYLPIVIIGFHPNVIISCDIISRAIQFIQHTVLLGKLPYLVEFLFMTPAHHKIHHAQNPEYIDKNYGGVLIIWDRMFGTYVEEIKTVPVTFGVPHFKKTYNPFAINFRHYITIWNDVASAKDWRTRLGYIFRHPSWRP